VPAAGALADLVDSLVSGGLDAGDNALIAHQDHIVAVLRTYADKSVDVLAADLEKAFPSHSLGEKLAVGDERATTANLAIELKAQIDAEAPVLFNLFVNGIAALSARVSGSTG
jgi:hypothetical protein